MPKNPYHNKGHFKLVTEGKNSSMVPVSPLFPLSHEPNPLHDLQQKLASIPGATKDQFVTRQEYTELIKTLEKHKRQVIFKVEMLNSEIKANKANIYTVNVMMNVILKYLETKDIKVSEEEFKAMQYDLTVKVVGLDSSGFMHGKLIRTKYNHELSVPERSEIRCV